MLASKIKPCMSQYEPLNGEIAIGSLKRFFLCKKGCPEKDNSGNSGDNACEISRRSRRVGSV